MLVFYFISALLALPQYDSEPTVTIPEAPPGDWPSPIDYPSVPATATGTATATATATATGTGFPDVDLDFENPEIREAIRKWLYSMFF